MDKFAAQLQQFEQAMTRLSEALQLKKDDIVRDSAIQRFEFTFDLAWKTVKTYLREQKGIVCVSPKDCIRAAYAQGLIPYDDAWLTMTDMRNETAHTYNEEVAEKIYAQLPDALQKYQALHAALTEALQKS